MAFDIGEALSNFGTSANNWLSSDQAPILLGQLAGAVQGGSPEAVGSWQTQLGNVASQFGQSNLAAKEKLAQEDERKKYQQFMQKFISDLLMGNAQVPLTADGIDGATTHVTKNNPDGTTDITIKGNRPKSGIGGPTKAPAASPSTGNFNDWKSALPFLSALQGSTGTGVNLAGLPPELIAQFARQGQNEQQIQSQSLQDVYSNMGKQAYADYLGRLPQQTQDKSDVWKWTGDKDASGHYILANGAGQTMTGPKAPKDAGPKSLTTGFVKMSKVMPDGSVQDGWVQTGSAPGAGTWFPSAGVPSVSPLQKEQNDVAPDLRKSQQEIEDNLTKDSTRPRVQDYNERAPNTATRFYTYRVRDWAKDGFEPFELPGLDMGQVRQMSKDLSTKAGRPVSVQETIDILYNKYGKKK